MAIGKVTTGHEGGAPLSCWVERSKPRYNGPSALIFYYVFLVPVRSRKDSFNTASNKAGRVV